MDEVIGKVPQLVKVAPPDEIQNLVRLALPGVTLGMPPRRRRRFRSKWETSISC